MLLLALPKLILIGLGLVVMLVALVFFLLNPGSFYVFGGAIIAIAAAWAFVKYRETHSSSRSSHRRH